MTTENKDEVAGIDPRDDEALWNLLGRQTPPVEASPYFARRVLREVAQAEERRGHWGTVLRRFWTLTPRHTAAWSGVFALGVLCLSAVLTIPASRPRLAHPGLSETSDFATPASVGLPTAPEAAPLAEVAPVEDVELIADLDNLLNREESHLWTDDTDTARF